MKSRPRSTTIVGVVFVAAGTMGLAYRGAPVLASGRVGPDDFWVLLVRAIAIVAGVFLIRGAAWARWLALAWTAYHVVLSAFHSVSETVVHLLVLAVVAYVLFRQDPLTPPSPEAR